MFFKKFMGIYKNSILLLINNLWLFNKSIILSNDKKKNKKLYLIILWIN